MKRPEIHRLSICYVSQEYPEETGWGGIGAYTYEMAHGLARAGHQVTVLARALSREQCYEEADGVTVYRVLPRLSLGRVPLLWRFNRLWEGYHLAVGLRLRQLVRDWRVDLIEAPALHGEPILYQWLPQHVPVVIRIHSCQPKELALNNIPNRLPLRKSWWLQRQSVTRAHGLSAPSRAIVKDNLNYLPFKNCDSVKVVPNPIDAHRFRPASDMQTSHRLEVLYVGRLQLRKGVHVLGQAIPLVWQDLPEAHFTFVGRDGLGPEGGSMREWIMARVPQDHNRVTFIPAVPRANIADFYQRASVVVFPSLWEPFGYVCTEGMACGKPVISTRSGGPEEIVEDGKTGFLVPPGDVQTLADKIVQVGAEPALRSEVGRAARQVILHKYDTPVVVGQMTAYYQSLLNEVCR